MRTGLTYYLLVIYLIAGGLTQANAQADFEGTIDFKLQNKTELMNYTYSVKGDKVKIDQLNVKTKKLENSFIVNLTTQRLIAINHDHKLWSEQTATVKATPPGRTEVIKTTNIKLIQGYTCTEYIVKNKVDGLELSYWVTPGKFDFFDKLLTVMNRRDKFSLYYLQIPDIKGMFPFLAIMSPITKMEKERLELTNIETKKIESSIFNIPPGYIKLAD
jgi:hypothetical protein